MLQQAAVGEPLTETYALRHEADISAQDLVDPLHYRELQ